MRWIQFCDAIAMFAAASMLINIGAAHYVAGNLQDDALMSVKNKPSERELANRLLERLMDVAYVTFKEIGGSEEELKQLQHKRGVITKCYFAAVSCY